MAVEVSGNREKERETDKVWPSAALLRGALPG